MRRTMIPVLVLAAAALSAGVVLRHLQPLQDGPDPVPGRSSYPHRPLTECEVLRKLYRSKSNRMDDCHLGTWNTFGYDTDNNQEYYNEYLNKGQRVSYLEDYWLGYPRQSDPSIGIVRTRPDPLAEVRRLVGKRRNNDELIRDFAAYYLYDLYLATSNQVVFPHDPYNCLYKTMLQRPTLPNNAAPTGNFEMQEERERLDTNEINPLSGKVMDKRYDASGEVGQKEIPDELVFNDGESVQKKLFSFWSRLQALSHKGRQVPTRRHSFMYYGPDDTRDGPLTAETRASRLRPPGQPLRWG